MKKTPLEELLDSLFVSGMQDNVPVNPDIIYLHLPTIDLSVKIHQLSQEDLLRIVNFLRLLFSKQNFFNLTAYTKALCKVLVKDSYALTKIIESVDELVESKDEGTPFDIWCFIYQGIVDVYPQLDVEFVASSYKDFSTFQASKLRYENLTPNIPNLTHLLGEKDVKNEPSEEMKPALDFTKMSGIIKLEKILKREVVGQDHAIQKLIDAIKVISVGFYKRSSFFFLGPTGVGKTKLARTFGNNYSGNVYKIDCNEYTAGHEHNKLIGSPPGYIGSDQGNILRTLSQKSNKWVFIFDEIEKAHQKFIDFIMVWMEEGRITDNQGHDLDFKESIFIFTSNCGIQDLKLDGVISLSKNPQVTYSNSHDNIRAALNKEFRPEFRNRIDEFIIFNELTKENLKDICLLELEGIPIKPNERVIDWIIEKSYNPTYGARELNRFIKSNITLVVADAMLEGRTPNNGEKLYDCDVVEDKFVLIGDTDEPRKTTRKKGTKSPGTSPRKRKTTGLSETRDGNKSRNPKVQEENED